MKIPTELALPPSDFEAALKLLVADQPPSHAPALKSDNQSGSDSERKLEELLRKMASKTASIATSLWRMRKRVEDPVARETKESLNKDEVRKLCRDIESISIALEEMGFSVRDRTGEQFDYGLPEKVIDAKPQTGITKERVAETLRPSVYWSTAYWKDTLVQKGEVIIHTPASNS